MDGELNVAAGLSFFVDGYQTVETLVFGQSFFDFQFVDRSSFVGRDTDPLARFDLDPFFQPVG